MEADVLQRVLLRCAPSVAGLKEDQESCGNEKPIERNCRNKASPSKRPDDEQTIQNTN